MSKIDEASEARALESDAPRLRLVRQRSATVGAAWASTSCHEMTQAGRKLEGGWPGTMAEARMLALRELTRELAGAGLPALSSTELSVAAAAVNDHARRGWLEASKAQRTALRAAKGSDDDTDARGSA